MILTGADAIRWARSLGRPVCKYADPIPAGDKP